MEPFSPHFNVYSLNQTSCTAEPCNNGLVYIKVTFEARMHVICVVLDRRWEFLKGPKPAFFLPKRLAAFHT